MTYTPVIKRIETFVEPHPAEHLCEAITLERVNVSYDDLLVLRDINLTIHCGQRVAVVGPNGAGKSTLFKAIVGLIPVDSGHLCVHGEPARQAAGRMAYVPQRENIDWNFPINVGEVVLMGRYGRMGWGRRPSRQDREAAEAALDQVNMREYWQRQIGELSGGQQQRVFLARALAQEADILLLDEPFTGVDANTESRTLRILDELQAQGKTVLVATHDLASVSERFERVVILNGELIAAGTVAEVLTPETLARAYGGQLALLKIGGETIMAINDAHRN